MNPKIRVLLVDDHTLFRSGIKSLLQRNDDFVVVDEAGDGLEGIKRARSLKPDVVLLDLHMPGVSGLEAVKVITEENPEVRVPDAHRVGGCPGLDGGLAFRCERLSAEKYRNGYSGRRHSTGSARRFDCFAANDSEADSGRTQPTQTGACSA